MLFWAKITWKLLWINLLIISIWIDSQNKWDSHCWGIFAELIFTSIFYIHFRKMESFIAVVGLAVWSSNFIKWTLILAHRLKSNTNLLFVEKKCGCIFFGIIHKMWPLSEGLIDWSMFRFNGRSFDQSSNLHFSPTFYPSLDRFQCLKAFIFYRYFSCISENKINW